MPACGRGSGQFLKVVVGEFPLHRTDMLRNCRWSQPPQSADGVSRWATWRHQLPRRSVAQEDALFAQFQFTVATGGEVNRLNRHMVVSPRTLAE